MTTGKRSRKRLGAITENVFDLLDWMIFVEDNRPQATSAIIARYPDRDPTILKRWIWSQQDNRRSRETYSPLYGAILDVVGSTDIGFASENIYQVNENGIALYNRALNVLDNTVAEAERVERVRRDREARRLKRERAAARRHADMEAERGRVAGIINLNQYRSIG